MHLPEIIKMQEYEQTIKRQRIALEEREVLVKERELDVKIADSRQTRWLNPLVVAIFAAASAGAGNVYIAWFNANEQRSVDIQRTQAMIKIERLKYEQTKIINVLNTPSADQAAENIGFLLEIGMISDTNLAQNLKTYLSSRKSGQGPHLWSNVSLSEFNAAHIPIDPSTAYSTTTCGNGNPSCSRK